MQIRRTLLTRDHFMKLRRGEFIHSSQFGLGKVLQRYSDDQIIIQFPGQRKRLRFEDYLLYVPLVTEVPTRNKITISSDGEKISFRKYKRVQKEQIEQEYILASQAAKVLAVSMKVLAALIGKKRIKLRVFGNREFIAKTDLQKLLG